jgi:hypothetical protein
MFIKQINPRARAVDAAVTLQRSKQPILLERKVQEPRRRRLNTKTSPAIALSFLTKPESQLRHAREELAEIDRHLKETTDKTKAQRAYDILEVVTQQLGCKAGDGCVIDAGVQALIFRAFDKAGYFTPDIPLDTSEMSAKAALWNKTHTEYGPLPRLPPRVFSEREYESLMKMQCATMLLELSNTYHIAFLILASAKHGGAGAGPWWCKGNLFSYMLYIKYDVEGATYLPLVVADPEVATAKSVTDKFRGFLTKRKQKIEKPLLFVIAADGVYSGKEARNQAYWWQQDCSSVDSRCVIMTPVASKPSRFFENQIHCELEGCKGYILQRSLNYNSGISKDESLTSLVNQSKLKVPLLAATCLLGADSPPSEYDRTQSFVLPFKISDTLSLGGYSKMLNHYNPMFVPPYRKNDICDDSRYRGLNWEQRGALNKRRLQNVDERLVSDILKKRKLR